jgi:hypothetical protein
MTQSICRIDIEEHGFGDEVWQIRRAFSIGQHIERIDTPKWNDRREQATDAEDFVRDNRDNHHNSHKCHMAVLG